MTRVSAKFVDMEITTTGTSWEVRNTEVGSQMLVINILQQYTGRPSVYVPYIQ